VSLMTPELIDSIAYQEIFDSAESRLEDWFDEDDRFSEEDFEKIYTRVFELLKELREKYV
jgi:broad specificity phosphatase PhoE